MTATCGLGTALIATGGFSYAYARMYCRPRRKPHAATPADFELRFEQVTFPSHGRTLKGWFIPARNGNSPAPAVVAAHGWSYNAAHLLPLVRLLHEAGIAVIAYDARGHGGSEGDGPVTIRKFAEDIISAVRCLEGRPDVDGSRIGVIGHSIGGAGGILAASMEPRIRALVSMAAFADPYSLTKRYMERAHIPRWPFLWLVSRFIESWLGAPMADVAPRNRIGRVEAPVLLIHGDADRLVPPSDMEMIYEQANEDTTLRRLARGLRHSDICLDPGVGSQVVDFLRGNLAGITDSAQLRSM